MEQHRSRLLEKLRVSSITELMRLTFDRRAPSRAAASTFPPCARRPWPLR